MGREENLKHISKLQWSLWRGLWATAQLGTSKSSWCLDFGGYFTKLARKAISITCTLWALPCPLHPIPLPPKLGTKSFSKPKWQPAWKEPTPPVPWDCSAEPCSEQCRDASTQSTHCTAPHYTQSLSSSSSDTEDTGDNSSKATIRRVLRLAKSIVLLSLAVLSLSHGSSIIASNA